ncbi:MAG TPA: hypothetical protein VKU87_06760 [Thermomicrobiaceae bacterium]|nr:hypothetical protein [Thermomicrobiaceae bacterium]
MSRRAALWTSAVLTIAIIFIIGAVLMRPTLSQSAADAAQPNSTLVTGDGAPQGPVLLTNESGQPTTTGGASQTSDGEHGHDHHNDHQEHDDGD